MNRVKLFLLLKPNLATKAQRHKDNGTQMNADLKGFFCCFVFLTNDQRPVTYD